MKTIARLCALAITCGASAMPAAAQYAIAPDAEWRGDFKTTVKGEYSISYSGTTAAADDAAGGDFSLDDDDLSAYRFFKLRAEEGLKTKGSKAD